jgi:SAM-dependent methyltransferase
LRQPETLAELLEDIGGPSENRTMGFYERTVVPRLVELTCGTSALDGFRRATTEGLTGRVLEIGFGSGTNVPHYPSTVTEVLAVEPSEVATSLAAARIAESPIPITHVGLDGGALELDDASCDGALITFTLCTLPDPHAALREVRRVLVPGGWLHLLEHGAAPDGSVARWQRRLDPLEVKLAGGCHLTRDPVGLVAANGFEVTEIEQRYGRGPRPWSFFTRMRATAP